MGVEREVPRGFGRDSQTGHAPRHVWEVGCVRKLTRLLEGLGLATSLMRDKGIARAVPKVGRMTGLWGKMTQVSVD